MPGLVLPLLLMVFFQTDPGYDLNLPQQPDLDLPIVLEHYDPANPAPGPVPPKEGDDPRDEPPPVFFGEEIPSEQGAIIFVLDFSESMSYFGRIESLREEFQRCITALPRTLRFNVVGYGCAISQWAPQTREATPEAKAEAIAWVNGFRPYDGTATGPAVALALSLDRSITTFVLLTDGEPTCFIPMEVHRSMIRNQNTQGAQINVFGIAATARFRDFCIDIARESGGTYCDVPLN